MSEVRGVLLDFYGTLVWEDDHIIAAICDDLLPVAREGVTRSEIARTWWGYFPVSWRGRAASRLSPSGRRPGSR